MDEMIQRLRDLSQRIYDHSGPPEYEPAASPEELDDAANAIERLSAALSAAEARVKELEGALRRTADGVVVLPGMKLYPLYPVDLGLPPEEAADFDDHAVIVLAAKDNETGDFVVEGDELDIGKCYSTPAAAAAARAEKEGEHHAQ